VKIVNAEHLSDDVRGVGAMRDYMVASLKRRFADTEKSMQCVLATLLNPTYKLCFFSEAGKKRTERWLKSDAMMVRVQRHPELDSDDDDDESETESQQETMDDENAEEGDDIGDHSPHNRSTALPTNSTTTSTTSNTVLRIMMTGKPIYGQS